MGKGKKQQVVVKSGKSKSEIRAEREAKKAAKEKEKKEEEAQTLNGEDKEEGEGGGSNGEVGNGEVGNGDAASNGTSKLPPSEIVDRAAKSVPKNKPTPDDFPEIQVTCATKAEKIHDNARDIVCDGLTVSYYGEELIQEASLNLAFGQRYGLVGLNGSGKTTLLRALVSRKVPLPKNVDVYSVQAPIEATEMTALESVLEVDEERLALERENDELTAALADGDRDESEQLEITERMSEIVERLDEMSADTAQVRAAKILSGLGFTPAMQTKQTQDFSGGWRMRISLARALFINPHFLVLDDASAHLDLEAVVWLEEYLKSFNKILLMVSHSQDFMNGVCTNIILLRNKKLTTYGGNFDTYIQTRRELETQQMKQYKWEQDQIQHMKDYIAKFGHGSAKLARQAQSKEKTLEKMVRSGLTEKVTEDRVASVTFYNCGKLPPPVLQLINVTFKYPGRDEYIYKHQEFGADLDSRIALVGPNGAGKSTLLKLIKGDLHPTDGVVRRHQHLRFATFAQHSVDELPKEVTPLDYIMTEFPKDKEGKPQSVDNARQIIGKIGLGGKVQTMKIGQLSDGQRARLVFAEMAESRPNFLLLDEPSNSLDIETIDALAAGVNAWDGGVIVVSHDFRLISQIADTIMICDHGLERFEGDIMEYKKHLQKSMGLDY